MSAYQSDEEEARVAEAALIGDAAEKLEAAARFEAVAEAAHEARDVIDEAAGELDTEAGEASALGAQAAEAGHGEEAAADLQVAAALAAEADELKEEAAELAVIEDEADTAAVEMVTEAVADLVVAEAIEEAVDDEAAAEEVLDEDALLEEAIERPISPYDRPGRWFVVHTQSGYEKKVKQNLEARISSMNMEERIYEVVIPMEDVVEVKNGKRVVVQKKMFPGYLLVRCAMDDDSWYVIRNTPGVTGFVGQGAKPSPLPRRDVESFLQVKATDEDTIEAARRGRTRHGYEVSETVRIKEGPFADFSGQITEINEDQLKVKVEVDIFGRPTPVELEFSQIAKL